MNNNKAFVETTILTDILLKPNSPKGKEAKALLNKYSYSQLPVYAIKEFKGGPLRYFVYAYNKCLTEKSLQNLILALSRLSLTPQRYRTATALEALAEAISSSTITTGELVDKYGRDANVDVVRCERIRLSLRTTIEMAWRRRRKITNAVVNELSCYKEFKPYIDHKGSLQVKPTSCQGTCCLSNYIRANIPQLKIIKELIDNLEPELAEKRENKARKVHLRNIIRHPKHSLDDDSCRALGDIYFALACPHDADILTTNMIDIQPLAASLGKNAVSPY